MSTTFLTPEEMLIPSSSIFLKKKNSCSDVIGPHDIDDAYDDDDSEKIFNLLNSTSDEYFEENFLDMRLSQKISIPSDSKNNQSSPNSYLTFTKYRKDDAIETLNLTDVISETSFQSEKENKFERMNCSSLNINDRENNIHWNYEKTGPDFLQTILPKSIDGILVESAINDLSNILSDCDSRTNLIFDEDSSEKAETPIESHRQDDSLLMIGISNYGGDNDSTLFNVESKHLDERFFEKLVLNEATIDDFEDNKNQTSESTNAFMEDTSNENQMEVPRSNEFHADVSGCCSSFQVKNRHPTKRILLPVKLNHSKNRNYEKNIKRKKGKFKKKDSIIKEFVSESSEIDSHLNKQNLSENNNKFPNIMDELENIDAISVEKHDSNHNSPNNTEDVLSKLIETEAMYIEENRVSREYRLKIKEMEDESGEIIGKNEILQRLIEEYRQKLSLAEKNNTYLKFELGNVQDEIKALKGSQEGLLEEIKLLREKDEHEKRIFYESSNSKNTLYNQLLEKLRTDRNTANMNNKLLCDKIKVFEKEINQLIEEKQSSQLSIDRLNSDNYALKEEMETTKLQHLREVDYLKKEIEHLNKEKNDPEVCSQNRKIQKEFIDNFDRKLHIYEKANAELSSEIRKSGENEKNLKNENEILRKELNRATDQISKLTEYEKQNSELSSRINVVLSEKKKFEHEFKSALKKIFVEKFAKIRTKYEIKIDKLTKELEIRRHHENNLLQTLQNEIIFLENLYKQKRERHGKKKLISPLHEKVAYLNDKVSSNDSYSLQKREDSTSNAVHGLNGKLDDSLTKQIHQISSRLEQRLLRIMDTNQNCRNSVCHLRDIGVDDEACHESEVA